MTIVLSLCVAIVFGAGAYLLLKHDFIKVIGGIILISHAANLFIMSTGLSGGREPIYPFGPDVAVSDPLVQAMTLTAIVISFGVTALLIALIYRVYRSHQSVDIVEISDIEERSVQREEAQIPVAERIEALEDHEDVDDAKALVVEGEN